MNVKEKRAWEQTKEGEQEKGEMHLDFRVNSPWLST
jgi:hypothetical protein